MFPEIDGFAITFTVNSNAIPRFPWFDEFTMQLLSYSFTVFYSLTYNFKCANCSKCLCHPTYF